jgi:hypothetical protein
MIIGAVGDYGNDETKGDAEAEGCPETIATDEVTKVHGSQRSCDFGGRSLVLRNSVSLAKAKRLALLGDFCSNQVGYSLLCTNVHTIEICHTNGMITKQQ